MIKSSVQVAGGISTVPAGNISQNVKSDYSVLSIGEKCVKKGLGEEEEDAFSIFKLIF